MSPAHTVLHDVFGYEQFRGPQQDIVEHVIGGGDALVLMPTGGGKSLCYQVPAIVRQRQGKGVTIVVSPLIALMHDQVGALHEAGVDAAFLNSTLDWQEALDVERRMQRGEITLLYVIDPYPFTGVGADFAYGQAQYLTAANAEASTALDAARDAVTAAGIAKVETVVGEGHTVHEGVLATVQSSGADLVVMGSHGRRGIEKLVLGSVTQRVLGVVKVPVLVVRD